MEYVVVALVSLLLTSVFVHALNRSGTALEWCRRQQEVLQAARSPGYAWDAPSEPDNVLRQRRHMLESLVNSPLMEGDVGAFLLRRRDAPNQHSASHYANLLVSGAIFFTILGLIFTVWGLAGSVGGNMEDLRGALKRFPLFFFPTAVGLFLGVLLSRRQGDVDDQVEQAWEELDLFTQTAILKEVLARQAASDPTAQLRQAVGELTKVASGMQTSFEKAGEQLKSLENLDQSRWIAKVEQAMEAFEACATSAAKSLAGASGELKECVKASAEGMRDAATQLKGELRVLPQISKEFADTGSRLVEGSQALEKTTSSTMDRLERIVTDQQSVLEVQQKVLELGAGITDLSACLNSVNLNFARWENRQHESFSELTHIIAELHTTIQPMVDHWKVTAETIHQHTKLVTEALGKVRENLAGTNQELREILQTQKVTFEDLGEKIATSLRDNHESFLAAIEDRFDQGEGLYGHLSELQEAVQRQTDALEPLREALARFGGSLAKEMEPLGETLEALPSSLSKEMEPLRNTLAGLGVALEPHKESLEESRAAMAALCGALAELRAAYVEVAHRPPGGDAHLEEIARSLEVLHRDIESLATFLGTPPWSRWFGRNGARSGSARESAPRTLASWFGLYEPPRRRATLSDDAPGIGEQAGQPQPRRAAPSPEERAPMAVVPRALNSGEPGSPEAGSESTALGQTPAEQDLVLSAPWDSRKGMQTGGDEP